MEEDVGVRYERGGIVGVRDASIGNYSGRLEGRFLSGVRGF